MLFDKKSTFQKIDLEEIDLENNFYKFSKKIIDDRLKSIIKDYGVLEPPVLLKRDNIFTIIFGHTVIQILKELGIEYVDSFIMEELNPTLYLNQALLKHYRNEIGPIGRLHLLQILRDTLNLDKNLLSSASKSLQIPEEFIQKAELSERAIGLPENLKDYIDTRDIGYKILKNILSLQNEAITLLNNWIIATPIRTKIFKNIIDMTIDINKKHRSISSIKNIDLCQIQDGRAKETFLYQEISKIRYPEYTKLTTKATNIIDKLKKTGVETNFPEYFEGDEIKISLRINTREGMKSFKKRLQNIDINELQKLLNLL